MKLGFLIYGSLDTLSGGYLYDRKLVEYLRSQGDTVEIISLPWRNYAAHLTDNFWFRLPDVVANLRASTAGQKSTVPPLPGRAPGLRPGRTPGLRSAKQQSPPHPGFDLLIQDELNHPSLLLANRGKHPYPIISLVHHLRSSELRPEWQNTFYRIAEKRYLGSVDGFIFNSRTTEKVVNSLVKNRKPNLIAYPPTDRFGTPISEEEIIERAQSAEFRILFLGNVMERKGLHTLLKAISSQPSVFRVDVIGSLTAEPAYVRQMQSFITHNDLSSFVFLHGSLDKDPLIEKLKQAHVLVVPSSYEGFGIVYLEGMCFGLPAIGTTAGAAGEIIENGQTGYLIEPNDSASLARHLKSLAEDRGLLTRLALNARKHYLRQPSWEATAESIRNFLSSIAK